MFNVSFKACGSLFIFILDDLSIGESGVLKSPTIVVLLSISSFIAVSSCLMYWGAPMLGSYIFIIVISSWIDSLDHYVVSLFVSCNSLYFKVYFVWYEYCYSSFLLISLFMEYLFSSPHFQSICVPRSKVFRVFLWQCVFIIKLLSFLFLSVLYFGLKYFRNISLPWKRKFATA